MIDDLRRNMAICKMARQMVTLLEAIPAADLESTIALRERHEKEAYGGDDAAVARAGQALTQTLKLILFFRTEILAIQASPGDQAAALRHSEQQLARAGGVGEAVREFLEGKS